MKKIKNLSILLLTLGLFSSCILTKPTIALKKNNELSIDTLQIYDDVVRLTTISPARNNMNMHSLNKAYDYIKGEFSKLECAIETQTYRANLRDFKNIIASFNSQKEERIIIGAHYDVCETTPGADDNASGVAGILALARLIDSLKPQLNYRIDIIAYSTEEPPYNGIPMGSWVHAKSIRTDSVDIEMAVVLDMIGYYSSKKNSQDFPAGFLKLLYPNRANFALVVSRFGQGRQGKKLKKRLKQVGNMKFRSINVPAKDRSLYSSDHGSYWVFDIKALLITDTSLFRNENYHELTDTPETLNYKHIGEIVKGIYWYLVNYK